MEEAVTETRQNLTESTYHYQRVFCSEECRADYNEGPFLDRVDEAVSKAQALMDSQLEAERKIMKEELDREKTKLKEERELLYRAMCPADKRRFAEWSRKRRKV